MISLNPLAIPMPSLPRRGDETEEAAPVLSIRALPGENADSDSGTSAAGNSLAGNELAAKNRIKQLKKQIEQLQQKLRRANARLAALKKARYRTEEARNAAIQPARAEVMALNSALSGVDIALFMAQKLLAGMVNATV
ncbi:hypothetical protein [Pseudomonas asplenii]|uniref:hypothetical protein n=1 Tax=Pseudomonas asplenii TaxID=53407 RepID=UPI00039C9FC7|nr:hypothetical protein [Pseudomonas fuscovaginae]